MGAQPRSVLSSATSSSHDSATGCGDSQHTRSGDIPAHWPIRVCLAGTGRGLHVTAAESSVRLRVATSSDGQASLDARLEETLAELLAAGAPGALALAIGPWGRLDSSAGLDSSGRPLKASARFEVGSITKTFVAALTLLLVEDGELGLDDEVTTQLSARYEPIGSVTLRSLLNHTSGIPDFFEDAGFAARWKENPNRAWDPDELLEVSLALPRHEPGVFSYANCNYVLIGLVIESVTGFSLAKLLRRRILDPIGLSATQLPESATRRSLYLRRGLGSPWG
jgi:D-alanyl-D-alanine carboxypeptidase